MIIFAGISNLEERPTTPLLIGIFAVFVAVSLLVSRLIERHYRTHHGEVTPSATSRRKNVIAFVAWVAVLFIGANRFLFWSPDSRYCVFAVALALATFAYYAILTGPRMHHIAIWGAIAVAGLLPIWGGLGEDRDPVAMVILGVGLIASGLLDQRFLVRSLDAARKPFLGVSNAGR
jgi:hypothetical protein